MKKISTMLFAVLLAMVLCACGASKDAQNAAGISNVIEEINPETADTEQIKADFDKASAFVASVVDLSDADIQTDDEDPANLYSYWAVDNGDRLFEPDNELMVNGQKIVIGETTVNDLETMGFKLEKPADVIGPDEQMSVTLRNDSKYFMFDVHLTEGEEEKPISDVPVLGFNVGAGEYAIPYEYMGISEDISFEKAIETLGMPNSELRVNSDVTGTSIEISYFNISAAEGITTDNILSLSFSYDADNDTAAISSVRMSRQINR